MFLFKKKMTPEELKTKLVIAEKKLQKRERQLADRKERSKAEAKEALKSGDERNFRMASKRYGLLEGQLKAIGGMVEMATVMLDMVEMQLGLKEVVEIGAMLKDYQEQIGIDTKTMEKCITNLQTSMDKIEGASEMINTSMEVMTSGDIAVSEAQESLRSELVAELEAEGGTGGLEEKIREAKKKL
jgi:hypothetical protein